MLAPPLHGDQLISNRLLRTSRRLTLSCVRRGHDFVLGEPPCGVGQPEPANVTYRDDAVDVDNISKPGTRSCLRSDRRYGVGEGENAVVVSHQVVVRV